MRTLRRMSRSGRIVLAVAVGGAVFGIATAVQASIPDSGVIHGCYGKPGTPEKGQLRVRDASQGEQCRYYENTLDWNQTGPTGPTGATGPTGPTGATGPTGPTGLAGAGTAATSTTIVNPGAGAFSIASVSITTSSMGNLLVNGKDIGASVLCTSAGACSATWGLYVDGVAIALSGQELDAGPSSSNSESVVVYGIASSIPPGTHTVQLEVASSANVASLTFGADEQVEAIAPKG